MNDKSLSNLFPNSANFSILSAGLIGITSFVVVPPISIPGNSYRALVLVLSKSVNSWNRCKALYLSSSASRIHCPVVGSMILIPSFTLLSLEVLPTSSNFSISSARISLSFLLASNVFNCSIFHRSSIFFIISYIFIFFVKNSISLLFFNNFCFTNYIMKRSFVFSKD